jgi:hypothetical protein
MQCVGWLPAAFLVAHFSSAGLSALPSRRSHITVLYIDKEVRWCASAHYSSLAPLASLTLKQTSASFESSELNCMRNVKEALGAVPRLSAPPLVTVAHSSLALQARLNFEQERESLKKLTELYGKCKKKKLSRD